MEYESDPPDSDEESICDLDDPDGSEDGVECCIVATFSEELGIPCQNPDCPRYIPIPHPSEAGSDPRGHLGVTWGVYLCAGKPPLADIILSHPPDLTRCDSVIGLAIPAMSGHIQYRGAASGDLYIRISGINRVLLS